MNRRSEEKLDMHYEKAKRKISEQDIWDSIKEKKQRVEQVVSGLNRAERDSVEEKCSSTTDIKEINNEDNNNKIKPVNNTRSDSYADVVTTSIEQSVENAAVTLHHSTTPIMSPSGKNCSSYPSVSSACFSKAVLSEANSLTQRPYFPVSCDNGIVVKKKLQVKTDILRVPRDNKTPLLIYTPPPLKASKPTNHVVGHPKSLLTSLDHATNVCVLNPRNLHRVDPANVKSSISRDFNWDVPSNKERVQSSLPSVAGKDVSKWSAEDVYTYLLATECRPYAKLIKEQEIDGCALLHFVDETMISKLLGVKMGPALKLNALIKQLKDR